LKKILIKKSKLENNPKNERTREKKLLHVLAFMVVLRYIPYFFAFAV